MTKHFFSSRESMYHYAASSDYDGNCIRSANSSVYDGEVYSYSTLVAKFNKDTEKMIYTGHYYSNTTSNSMNELRRAFDHFKCMKVFDFTVREGWNRLTEAVKLHSKHPATRKDDKEYFINTVRSFANLVEYYGVNDRHMKSATMEKAIQISDKYATEIEIKYQKAQERRAKKRAEEERKRVARLELSEKIVNEYNDDLNVQPTKFRQCMDKTEIKIPMSWIEEHHPEILNAEYISRIDRDMVNFDRGYDYMNGKWNDNVTVRRQLLDFKILRHISRYSNGNYSAPADVLVYDSDKHLRTSQHVDVDDTAGHVKTLLGLFLKAVDEGRDTSFVIGKHCGPYEIREYNASEKFLRVGCHCFLLENLREVYNDMKGE